LSISGDNIVGGKTFPDGKLNGVLKIVPINIPRCKAAGYVVLIRYWTRVSYLMTAPKGRGIKPSPRIKVQRLKDMAVRHRGRIKDLHKALYGFTCGAFSKILSGDVKNIGYCRRGDVTFDKVPPRQAKNQRRLFVPGLTVQQNIKSNIRVN